MKKKEEWKQEKQRELKENNKREKSDVKRK